MKTSDRQISLLPVPVILVCIFLASCSPVPLLTGQTADPCGLPVIERTGKAFGDITYTSSGETINGSIDLQKDAMGLLHATLYGPLGMTLASITADSLGGTLSFGGKKFSFSMEGRADSLPFEFGTGSTYGDWLRIVSGRLPAYQSELMCKIKPDSIEKKRNTIIRRWKTDSLETTAVLKGKDQKVVSVFIVCKNTETPQGLKMWGFRCGRAHKIEFKVDDGNYFLIKYSKMAL